jgi:murein L,D-transpeptidase YcbB/YkuD
VEDSGPSLRATQLLAAIAAAGADGLNPDDYPGTAIRGLLEQGREPDSLARRDLLFSRTLLAFGSDLSRGRVDPTTVDSAWTRAPPAVDFVTALEIAADSGRLADALERLAPPQQGYARLRRALQRYRDLAAQGGWPIVPAGPQLAPGDPSARVSVLRARLALEGEVGATEQGGDVYDAALADAVRRFQTRHGLEADGVVGAATLAALNVSVDARIRQIGLNLERWRWLPRALGERYVMVNSAAFVIDVVDRERAVMRMRAIVGRLDRPTPILSARITGLLFAPAWSIPRSIAVEELLPVIRHDPAFLRRERIHVFADSAPAIELDPATVAWSQVSDSTFAFTLRQDPGHSNPLGGVRFVSPNRFTAYLHDTPFRALFERRVRTFSHGCVRAARAADLAELLLSDSGRWPRDSVRAAMAQPRERWVALPEAVPVHLAHWTAWVDEDGTVEFRDDVYGWDARLAAALAKRRARG